MAAILISGVKDFDYQTYASALQQKQAETHWDAEEVKNDVALLNRRYIESKCSAYILERASQMQIELSSAEVTLAWNTDGFWYPVHAEMTVTEENTELSIIERPCAVSLDRFILGFRIHQLYSVPVGRCALEDRHHVQGVGNQLLAFLGRAEPYREGRGSLNVLSLRCYSGGVVDIVEHVSHIACARQIREIDRNHGEGLIRGGSRFHVGSHGVRKRITGDCDNRSAAVFIG